MQARYQGKVAGVIETVKKMSLEIQMLRRLTTSEVQNQTRECMSFVNQKLQILQLKVEKPYQQISDLKHHLVLQTHECKRLTTLLQSTQHSHEQSLDRFDSQLQA